MSILVFYWNAIIKTKCGRKKNHGLSKICIYEITFYALFLFV